MGKVTVILSSKGGSGGSFVTAGLGTALAKRGKSVLIADCGFGMREIDMMLGISDRLVFDLGDVLSGNCKVGSAVYPSDFADGLYVLPAPQENISVSADTLKSLLETLDYDYILADCHSDSLAYSLSRYFQPAVTGQPEPLSVRCGNRVFLKCRECGGNNIRLIINRFSEKDFFDKKYFSDLDEVIDKVGARLLGIVPEDDTLSSAFQRGLPLREKTKALYALDRIAARIDGVDIPLF